MKFAMILCYGIGFCAATAAGVWLSQDPPTEQGMTAAQAAPNPSERSASTDQASNLWDWGSVEAGTSNEKWDVLLAHALRPSHAHAQGEDSRDKLRKLANEDPAVLKQLIHSYDKQTNPQARQLIVSLLSNVEKPEVLAFSKRLALSSDSMHRKDGLAMLQNLNGDMPEVHPVILQTLSRDKSPEVVLMALAALKPPTEDNTAAASNTVANKAAIVAQLQDLARNADPNIRAQSIMQLAQWDKTGSSQEQWAQALIDQSPQVRQAAVSAIAESGVQSDTVKTALLGVANNQNESRDVRGNALQVLEGFNLSKEEAVNLNRLRTQVLDL